MVLTVYSPGLWQDLVKHVAQIAPLDRMALLYSRLMLCTAGHIPTADLLQVIVFFVKTLLLFIFFVARYCTS